MQHCFVLSSFARMEVPIFVQVMRIVIITSYPTPHRYMQIHILTYHVLSVDPGTICKINNSKSILEMVMTALFNYLYNLVSFQRSGALDNVDCWAVLLFVERYVEGQFCC